MADVFVSYKTEDRRIALNRALTLDPLNSRALWSRAYILGNACRYADALAAARHLLKMSDGRTPPHAFVGHYLCFWGEIPKRMPNSRKSARVRRDSRPPGKSLC